MERSRIIVKGELDEHFKNANSAVYKIVKYWAFHFSQMMPVWFNQEDLEQEIWLHLHSGWSQYLGRRISYLSTSIRNQLVDLYVKHVQAKKKKNEGVVSLDDVPSHFYAVYDSPEEYASYEELIDAVCSIFKDASRARAIIDALIENGGNGSKTAAMLGLPHSAILYVRNKVKDAIENMLSKS